MKEFLRKITDAIFEYGKAGAGMPSFRGVYETPVPAELQNENDHT